MADENKSVAKAESVKLKAKKKTEYTMRFGGKDGETVVIKKLKAGKFYESIQLFADILSAIGGSVPEESNVEQQGNALKKMFEVMPDKIIQIISMCSSMSEEDIKLNAYPEEIEEAWAASFELNNPLKNLKNLTAPMGAGAL